MSNRELAAAHIVIVWAENEAGAVTEVFIAHRSDGPPEGGRLSKPIDYLDKIAALFELNEEEAALSERRSKAFYDDNKYDNSRGCIESEWLKHPRATPEAVFMSMLEQGFADRGSLDSALAEFADVKECGWARNLQKTLGAS